MSIKTEGVHAGEFLLSEANGTRSRAEVVITAGAGILAAGTLIAMITAANATIATADVGNTGNGVMGTVTTSSAAVSGIYVLTITEVAANGGLFEVVDPLGSLVGAGSVGAAFDAGGLSFTLADGTADFIVGDVFTLAVTAALGEYRAYDDAGTDDGRRAASGILYASVDASLNDIRALAVVRDAEVIERLLTGLDDAGAADLAGLGIVVCP